MKKTSILVTGASGQIGAVLTETLRQQFGESNVIASDIQPPTHLDPNFEKLDILDRKSLERIVKKHKITHIYHLAAILSAKGEKQPMLAWNINMNGLFNVLKTATDINAKVFFPSSIAVFGSRTPKDHTPQFTVQEPSSVYGISKVAGESWCQYYHQHFGLDVRSIRYPGIISYQTLPGGGTTDYAVDIFHSAVKGLPYECFLSSGARLPMMYMPDAIRATLQIMEAPAESIKIRTSYNLASMSFTPAEIAAEIQKHRPGFQVSYQPDYREEIAASWPSSIDDSAARQDWGWKPEYNLAEMTKDMLFHLGKKYELLV